jgi:hypothetical protein
VPFIRLLGFDLAVFAVAVSQEAVRVLAVRLDIEME